MALQLNLPAGFYHAQMLFTGPVVPQGAAMTFGGSYVGATPSNIATTINSYWNTHLRPVFHTDITHAGTRVKQGPMVDGPFSFVTSGLVGGFPGQCSPPNVSFLIRKSSTIGGRQGSGRLFQPGVIETDVDGTGAVRAAWLTTMQAAYLAFFNALTSGDLDMHLIHSGGTTQVIRDGVLVNRVVPDRVPTPVTGLSVDSSVATQRRRLR